MFEIGFPELILIAIVGLLVIGPERLPEALRTLGLWVGRMRRSFTNVKAEIEKEIGMDEIRRQLHNEAVMEEMKRIERDVRDSVQSAAKPPVGSAGSTGTESAATGSAAIGGEATEGDSDSAASSHALGHEPAPSSSPSGNSAPGQPSGPPAADDARHG
jgi:sec-independent protein translocase protein TatB